MDRNTIAGLVLIGVIMVVWSVFFMPKPKKITPQKTDTTAVTDTTVPDTTKKVSVPIKETAPVIPDSLAMKNEFGKFFPFAEGQEKTIRIENEHFLLGVSTKGASVKSVLLKEYKDYHKQPLKFFDGDSNYVNLTFPIQNRSISTKDLFFTYLGKSDVIQTEKNGVEKIPFRLAIDDNNYIEIVYTLTGDSYTLDYEINIVGMKDVIANNATYYEMNWRADLLNTEHRMDDSRQHTTAFYKWGTDNIDNLTGRKEGLQKDSKQYPVQWVSYKTKFFSGGIIFQEPASSLEVESDYRISDTVVTKKISSLLTIPYESGGMNNKKLKLYFGPNRYRILKAHGNDFERQLDLGWPVVRQVNQYAVIPLFKFLEKFIPNYGIIIIIIAFIVKIVLFPLTYKSYVSSAKMKVLAPQLAPLKEKYKNEPARLQQETMAFYKQAGVNPLGGCLPVLLQFPVLVALFYFFPQSIELRQQKFLWATDLSTYDSVWNFPNHFSIPFYGDHVSLFTLLMTATTIVSTILTQSSAPQQPGMKYMPYIMTIMFLGIFNNYSAGLSIYYLFINIISIGQQYVSKGMVDEKKLLEQMEVNKKKIKQNAKKGFWQRKLDEASKRAREQSRPKARR